MNVLSRAWLALGFVLLGDRAMLRPGGPGPLARAFGMRTLRYLPHPYMLYAPNPAWRSADGLSRHNSLGFRGAEISPRKHEGTVRVVCMGESSTYGSFIDDDSLTYPARLEVHLRAAYPGRPIEVVNAAAQGFTTAENVLRALFDVVPLRPDLVVYYYTHNDVHPRRYPKLSRDYREYSRSWFEPHSGGRIRGAFNRVRALALGDIGALVRRTETHGGKLPSRNIAANPPIAFEGNLRAIDAILRAAGVRTMYVNPPYRELALNDQFGPGEADPEKVNLAFRAVWEHRRIVETLAREVAAGLCDLAGIIPYPDRHDDFPTLHHLDPAHFSATGADEAARIIAKAIVDQALLPSTPVR